MDRRTAITKLADLIEANPECSFDIYNDIWYIMDKNGEEITNSESWNFKTNWYGPSYNYGFGLSEVLVELLNRRNFSIEASAL